MLNIPLTSELLVDHLCMVMVLVDQLKINLEADKDGLLGRSCFNDDCKKYFKMNLTNLSEHIGDVHCPYCGNNGVSQAFTTQEQIEYAQSIVYQHLVGKIGTELKKLEIKPNPRAWISFGVSVTLPNLPHIKHYTESEIKNIINCVKCNNIFAVYGISYFCPFCGPRDNFDVFLENIEQVKKKLRLKEIIKESTLILQNEGLLYDLIEDALKDIVGVFESYCKNTYVKYKLIQQPQLDKNKLLLDLGNSFQNIDRTKSNFKKEFEIDLESFVTEDDLKKMVKAFAKRHILTHSSGIIDLKYIQQTGEDIKLLDKRITVNSQEVMQLLEYIVSVVTKLNEKLKSQVK